MILFILTKYVLYRGKKKLVSELSPTCGYKVDVKCPICGKVRNTYYRSVVKAGHYKCPKCTQIILRRKYLKIGSKYGNLTVIDHSKRSGFSICICDCGQKTEVSNYNLKIGWTFSCGCLRKLNFDNVGRPKGKYHGRWKGGISSERERFMQTTKYKEWRERVFKRDRYTCQKCGQVGHELNAHHIRNYADNPHLRVDVSNGITLCISCHNSFHSEFGLQNTNEEQIGHFLPYAEKYYKEVILNGSN